ncbi:MAG: ISAzo13 family transposase, partial [Methylocella sp.]
MIDEAAIRNRYEAMRARLDERERRVFTAAEARAAGYGGVSAVARATGIARSTIDRGLKELVASEAVRKIRRAGGGRRSLTQTDPTLLEDLRRLLEPATLGDPMRPLVWVSKSHAKLALALRGMGHRVSASRIPQLLERLGYRRQVNRKTKEGGRHPDRDAQFEHINTQVLAFQAASQPVISVDTKKKELIGAYKNAGSDYRPQGRPIDVNVHDFIDKELGKAIPYGVYD